MAEGQVAENKQDYSFGQIAIRESLVTFEQVKECLDIQAKLRTIGLEPKKLGEILIEKGYLSPEKAQHIIRLQTASPPPQPKFQIPGYEIMGKIGSGAMGSVFKARQVSMDRIVAIKVLAPKYSKDNAYVQRFLYEARAVAKLNHENVISGIDVGESNGLNYFVMEFVEGTSVASLLKKQGHIDEKRCLQIGLQIARALDHAHRHKMVHRDVKPENVLITPDGTAKLCDLGLAKRVEQGGDASLTMDGMSVGTPNYISPEQARGEENIDIRTDVYSLGASLYHMSTGQVMFDGPNPMAVMTKHVTDPVVPPKQLAAGLSEGFNALVMKLVMKHRQDRYQAPADVMADIEKLLRGEPVQGSAPAPLAMRDSRTQPGKSSSVQKGAIAGPRPHPVNLKRSPSIAPFVIVGAIVMAAIVGYVMFGGGTKTPVTGTNSNSNTNTNSTHTNSTSEDTAQAHEDRLSAFRSIRDRLLQEKDPTQLTEPYSRLEDNIAFFRNTKFEETWRDEKKKFVDDMNARIEAAEWAAIRAAANDLKGKNRIADAIAKANTLPEVFRHFKKAEPAVLTQAGVELKEFIASCKGQVETRWAEDRMKVLKFTGDGKTDDALTLCDEMARYAGPEREHDIDGMRQNAVSREMDRLLADPLTTAKVAGAVKKLDEFEKRYPTPAFGDYARRKRDEAQRRLNDSMKAGLEVAANVYKSEFSPAFRKAMETRDLAAARRLLQQIYFDPKYANAHTALMLIESDADLLRAYLAPGAAGGHDYRKLQAAAEEGFRTAVRTGQRDAARDLYADLREAILLEEVLDLALKGAESFVKDRSASRTGLSGWLVQATEAKLITRAPEKPVQIDAGTRSAMQRITLAPAGIEPSASAADIVALARKSYASPAEADKCPHQALRSAILFWYAKDLSAAKDAFAKVAADVVGTDRYLADLKGIASPKEEDYAKKRYTEAVNLWLANKKKEAAAIFRELVESYSHTIYMNEKKGAKTRLESASGWVAEVDGKPPVPKEGPKETPKDPKEGAKPPGKVEDLFPHAKPKDLGKGRYEVAYDFDKPEQLDDFTKEGMGLGANGTFEVKDKVLEGGEGALFLYWNPVLKGDVTAEYVLRARDTKNIGFLVHGNGGFTNGSGYVAWLGFSNESGFGPKKMYVYNHPIIKMPWNQTTARTAYVGSDVGTFTLQKDARYNIRVTRKAKALEVAVDGKVVANGENGEYNEGRSGLAFWASQVTVESAKFTGELDPKWIEEAMKRGGSGGLDVVDPKDGPPKKPADKK